jgi:hypothetical protein
MRVTITKPEPIVTIELTATQAEVLCALLGGLRRRQEDGQWLVDLFCRLTELLPDRVLTFSDYFRGEVTIK